MRQFFEKVKALLNGEANEGNTELINRALDMTLLNNSVSGIVSLTTDSLLNSTSLHEGKLLESVMQQQEQMLMHESHVQMHMDMHEQAMMLNQQMTDPYQTPGLDMIVDESHHGIDHGMGIANPDHNSHDSGIHHHDHGNHNHGF